ncbi:MAG: DUF1592 domain-containing protein [Planctomycetota bacterium]|nr:DUF1592 domain-containing protein [Planctomycetota bacterium]
MFCSASAAATQGAEDFSSEAGALLDRYCVSCHRGEKPKAGLNLASARDSDSLQRNRKKWEAVSRMLGHREMPPKKAKQPTEKERLALREAVDAELDRFDCDGAIDPGRPTLRRLSRYEYARTVRDLIGLKIELADDFPADDVGYGFDNIGDVLSIPPLRLEKYIDSAEEVVEKLFATLVAGGAGLGHFEGEEAAARNLTPNNHVRRANSDPKAAGIYSNYELSVSYDAPESGDYLLRARAYGSQAGTETVRMGFRIDGKTVGEALVKAVAASPKIYETRVTLKKGKHRFGVALLNDYDGSKNPNPALRGDRNLFIDWFQAGLFERKKPAVEASGLIVRPLVEDGRPHLGNIRKTIETFVTRAWRRPLQDGELERFIRLGRTVFDQDGSMEDALRIIFQAALSSPNFLFRVELDAEPENPAAIHPVGPYELAVRLSYFLWSSMPDDELFRLAADGTLGKPAVLEAQVRRMLRDPRSGALAENFAEQWLQTRFLAGSTPDPDIFPAFDAGLRAAMREETRLFFSAIVREDRSVLEFIDSDFTYVNERLARHYGMEGVSGAEFRKVSVAGTPRGGMLTQGSVLTLTSYPTRTSPVFRGKWILEQFLSTPPPPPPPDVPELESEGGEALTGSLRQRLEKHRLDPACAVCHDRLDPLGFALENFDAIGAWREFDGKFLVDSSAVLPGGKPFEGPSELKQLLKKRPKAFVRALSEKMLTYALGRGLEYYDKCTIDQLVDLSAAKGYKISSLISGIVQSDTFRLRRGGRSVKQQ